MFNSIRRQLGLMEVKQTATSIIVNGIPADVMARDISRIWGTSKITTNMFIKIDKNSFIIPNFFAPDIVYTIETIIKDRTRNSSVRFLNSLLDKLLTETWLAQTDVEEVKGRLNFSKIEEMFYKPLPFQMDFINIYNTTLNKYNLKGYLLAAAAGSGKAQPLDARIKVPGGWSTMGNMQVGTEVIARDGSITKVKSVHPQGLKEIYKVTFGDGRSTECCGEHLWNITRPKGHELRFKETVNTLHLIDCIKNGTHRGRIHIDLPEPDDCTDVGFVIDPYLLGLYLGDGGSTQGVVHITTPDQFIVDEIVKYLPQDCRLTEPNSKNPDVCPSYRIIKASGYELTHKTSLIQELVRLELLGLFSYHKFIPSCYLQASKAQRLALLQGLMDSDGTCDIQSTCSYSTTSLKLALDVQYLVRSLGGIAKIASRIPAFTYLGVKKNGRLAYQVNIRYKKPSELFRLPKKKERTNDDGQYTKGLKLRLNKIEKVGFKIAQCIAIEHPEQLYITDDFIVTHNTNISLTLANCLEADLVVVVCPKNATERVWEDSIKKLFKLPQTYWLAHRGIALKGDERFVVGHYEALDMVAEATKSMMKTLGPSAKIMVILDESHNLNEISSLRTEKFIRLCEDTRSQDVLWMSGTAIKALGSETIPLLKTIDSYFTDDVQERFKKIYGKDAKKGLDILKNRIGMISFKVEKSELALLDPIMKPVKVTMPTGKNFTLNAIANDMQMFVEERKKFYALTDKQDKQTFYAMLDEYEATLKSTQDRLEYQKYRQCLKTVISCYVVNDLKSAKEESMFCNKYEKVIGSTFKDADKELFRHVKTIAKYVLLKIQGECLGRVLSRKRIECHVDMVAHIDFVTICESSTKKTIVFTSFVEALKEADKVCAQAGLSPKVVYGGTNSELVSILKEFESNPDINPLIATYNSLSTAVPLIMADTMITVNFPFRDYVFQQAVSRIHRLGADTQTYIYTVTLDTGSEPNISTRSADILVWSQKQVTAIMGIESPFEVVDGQSPSLEQLEEGVYLKITSEEYDVNEIITFESLKDIIKAPAYASW